jgi:hypothetical protein
MALKEPAKSVMTVSSVSLGRPGLLGPEHQPYTNFRPWKDTSEVQTDKTVKTSSLF